MDQATEFAELTRRLYDVVSAPAEERDWESIRSLYHPRATLVRTGIGDDGQPFVLAMSFDEYVENANALLERVEFNEVEIEQRVEVFGNVARIASVYEFRFRSDVENHEGRGVNFFNLVNEGDGWKIMSIVWDNEREGLSLTDARIIES